jgi:uncharacterized membrane protein
MAAQDTDSVEMTIQRMAELHAAHLQSHSPLQRLVSRFTRTIYNPRAAAVVLLAVLLWVILNTVAPRIGLQAFDGPPFAYLQVAASVVALFTTLLILATQSREEEAGRHRSQLTLQLASLSEQKIAKVIELLEEQRRDNPQLASRRDPQADEMSKPADPAQVLDRIKDTHEEF